MNQENERPDRILYGRSESIEKDIRVECEHRLDHLYFYSEQKTEKNFLFNNIANSCPIYTAKKVPK